MNKLCCIRLSLAARIISAYSLSLSILILNVSMSHYFSREDDDDFFNAIESWALFGLNWIQFLRHSLLEKRAQTAMICFLVYNVLFLLTSAYLALGSISRKAQSAVPWMYLQMISIIDQSVALAIHLTHSQQYAVYDKSLWYIPVSSVYLLLSVYFWMVIQVTRWEWCNEEINCQSINSNHIAIIQPPATESSSCPKTPSFLSQNFTFFESPRYSTPSKYNI
ncbi:uncharacterized protein [Prorops nasuta]|uniref:uncharacterized protein n=1 Tax=Prorops nasuta TaxID=863751 RepID=UPI0034CD8B3E